MIEFKQKEYYLIVNINWKCNGRASIYFVFRQIGTITPNNYKLAEIKSSISLSEQHKFWDMIDWVCKTKRLRAWTNNFTKLIELADDYKEIMIGDTQFRFNSLWRKLNTYNRYIENLKCKIVFSLNTKRKNEILT